MLGLRSLSIVYHDCPSVATVKRLSDFMKRLPQTLETLRIAGFVKFDPVEEQPSTVDPGGSSGDTNDDNNDDTNGDTNDDTDGISSADATSSNLENTRIKQLLLEGNLPLHVPLSFIKRCPELRSLSITAFSDEILEIVARYIGEYCPQLEELAVGTIEIEFPVGFELEEFDLHYLSDLLVACSNVQECSTSDPNSSESPLSNQELQSHEPTPVNRAGLKKLLLGNINFLNQTCVIDTLCRHHSSTLTHLAMKSCNGIWIGNSAYGVAPVHTILKSFQKLEYIDFSFSEVSNCGFGEPEALNAADLVNSCMTWPFASTLRVLHIAIDGITRPIAHNSQNGIQAQDQSSDQETQAPLETQTTLGAQAIPGGQATLEAQKVLEAEASVKIQTKVCQLLGSLTRLEELSLGVDEDDGPMMSAYPTWGYQSSCLELSLETGLRFMSGLKRLRILKVTRMDHRIGLKELQWMCESWPKLKEVKGLLRSQEDAIYDLKFMDVLKEAETVGEMLDWVREHYPQLRYT
ncbi:hypothetical protein BGX20_008821 [Mortierella sp. AD010]|nr:hypothetical protein BGX20_008821 [Mortierella sp. AD010]